MQTLGTNRETSRALMGVLFYPRGGSSHVVRNLAAALPEAGWDVTIVSGSLLLPGRPGEARRFYAGRDVRPVDFTASLEAPEPLLADPPLQPSYEDRPGAPDRVKCSLDDDAYERHVAAWERELTAAGAAGADVLHLHHLTPLNEAAARVTPDVPVVAHLHGTELLMLERIAEGPPPTWTHAEAWAERLRRWAARAERLLLLSPSQLHRVERLLGIGPERCLVTPNGFDPDRFAPRPVDRAAHWREHLVEHPRGWRPGADEGSVRYTPAQIAPLAEDPVLLAVGRFTEVKRLPLLIRAFARARRETETRASLVL